MVEIGESGLLMKIVRAGDGAGDFQFGEAAGAYVDHAVLLLQRPLGHQERRAMQERAILLKEIGRDYHVGDSRLVLHRDEEEALGRTGTLTHDHDPFGAPVRSAALSMPRALRRVRIWAIRCGPIVTPVDE